MALQANSHREFPGVAARYWVVNEKALDAFKQRSPEGVVRAQANTNDSMLNWSGRTPPSMAVG
jgi:hypothetical protein